MMGKTLSYVGKLVLCGLIFSAGYVVGGMLAVALGLESPPLPVGAELQTVVALLVATSPIFALGLAVVSRGLNAGFIIRTAILSFLAWTAYAVNTALDATLFTASASVLFTSISNAVPCLLCGAAVAFFFPPRTERSDLSGVVKEYFKSRQAQDWARRLAAAAVAFVPVYIVFGLLVNPFTGEYYSRNMYGLKAATWAQIVPMEILRSALFMLSSLPVVMFWKKTRRSLFLSLGLALFVFVGLLYMLGAHWLPVFIRTAHGLEILADSFVHAGLLTLLLSAKTGNRRPGLSVQPSRV